MKTNWDYTNLADAYLKRPDYSEKAIEDMIEISNVPSNARICDIGAGVAHLTLMFLKRGYDVVAVEPNDAMRANGIKRTEQFKNIFWYEGTGENTNQNNNEFDLVTFGSSFNVTNKTLALKESKRILKSGGWFACLWNHRNIEDKIQNEIEKIIKKNIPEYNYGTRREDQMGVLRNSGLFDSIFKIEGEINHDITIEECIIAWKSHATLERQAGNKFDFIIKEIEKFLNGLNVSNFNVPYTTRVWIANLKK